MGQEILTPTQKKVIKAVGLENALSGFYLSGGTALAAYHFRHRFSDDLDFFTFDEPDKMFLHAFADKLKTMIKAKNLVFKPLYDRNIFTFSFNDEELKVEFTKYPFIQLENPLIKDGIKIDSLRDVSANKLMTMIDRFDPKDFVDLFFILKEYSMEETRGDVEKKFGAKIDDITLGSELMKVMRVMALPRMVKEVSLAEIKTFFVQKAKELGSRIFE